MDPLLVIPGLYGLYMLYLLIAGAGRERTHKVLGQAALYSGLSGVAVASGQLH